MGRAQRHFVEGDRVYLRQGFGSTWWFGGVFEKGLVGTVIGVGAIPESRLVAGKFPPMATANQVWVKFDEDPRTAWVNASYLGPHIPELAN